MRKLTANRWVWAIALLHLILALGFAAVTPYRTAGRLKFQGGAAAQDIGAPDERQHVNYVQRLKDGNGLPVFDPKDPNLYETYQSHQPPLFYGLATLWTLGVPDLAAPEAKMRVRSLNAVLGAGAVLGVFFLALWATRREAVALGAAAFAAALPMNVALSGAVSNDPLLILLCTWALAYYVRGAREGWCPWRMLVAGLLTGMALLTKSTAVALLIPALIALRLGWPQTEAKDRAKCLAAAFLPILALAGPWWVRNTQLYGDPLALKAFGEAFTGTAQARDFIQAFGAFGYWTGINDLGLGVGWWTLRSLVGAFGYMDVFLPSPVVAAFGLFLLACLFGWSRSLKAGDDEDARKVQTITVLFALLIGALFLRFNAQYFQAQARYLLPALGCIALGVSAGWAALTRRESLWWLPAAALLALDVWLLVDLPAQFAQRIG